MAKHQYSRTFKQYTLLCSDNENTIYDLLKEISKQTKWGHSFDVVVDPNRKSGMTFFIDGDGCDKIHSIEEQEIIKTYEIDLEKLQQDANNLASCEKEMDNETA